MLDISLRVLKKAVNPSTGVCLFAMARNEMYFLPHFLDYYRALGVLSFVIYDDNSTDGSFDFLMRQPDCAIIRGNHEFGTDFGVDALGAPRRYTEAVRESAPEIFFPSQWTLVMDLDEFIVLPEGFSSLPDYCDHLESQGQFMGWGSLVDVYQETLNSRNYDWNGSPFDRDFYFDVGPYMFWQGDPFPNITLKGVRSRLLHQLKARFPDEINAIYGGRMLIAQPNKSPLVKHGAGVKRIGIHFTNVTPSGPGDCAILHFKFTPSMDGKIEHALRTRAYALGSLEYRFLKFAIDRIGDESLIGGESRLYTGPSSLADAGLLAKGFSAGRARSAACAGRPI